MRAIIVIFPFCAFLVGYYSLYYLFPITSISVPSLIGLPFTDACILLSRMQLAPRILEEKIEAETPAGTILHQIPSAGSSIKPYQTIGLVISQISPNQEAPDYRTMPQKTIESDAHTKGIKYKIYYVPSTYPHGTCIGQWPPPSASLIEQRMILYFPSPKPDMVIVPDVRGLSVDEVCQLCLRFGIPCPVIRKTSSSAPPNIILDQRPLPGSILSIPSIFFNILSSA